MDARLHQLQGKAERLTPVAIALGSNLGDRRGHIVWAFERLHGPLTDLRLSKLVETIPVDVPDEQPPYLNAAVTGKTMLGARALLNVLSAIEAERGRRRGGWHAPRTIDLDLILYGDSVMNEPGLVVPHPRFREREFVLAPLTEVGPELIDPVTGRTVGALADALKRHRDQA